MDLRKIIHELEIEKQRLDEAILALERLSTAGQTRTTTRKTFEVARETPIHDGHGELQVPAVAAHSLRK